MIGLVPTPTPTPTPTDLAAEPSWTDIGTFWATLGGAIGTVAVAIVAVVISVQAARVSRRREDRDRREAWAKDFMLWLKDGVVHMMTGGDTIVVDSDYVKRGDELQARAELMDPRSSVQLVLKPEGAVAFMLSSKEATKAVGELPVAKRMDAARNAASIIRFWLSGWVRNPKKGPGTIRDWIILPEGEQSEQDAAE